MIRVISGMENSVHEMSGIFIFYQTFSVQFNKIDFDQ